MAVSGFELPGYRPTLSLLEVSGLQRGGFAAGAEARAAILRDHFLTALRFTACGDR